MNPFTSPKEKATLTSAENRHSAKANPYQKVDGAQVGLLSSSRLDNPRLQTLLPNIKKGGGGALIIDADQGARDLGLGPGRYGDAIEMIEACIDKARLNVQDIQESNLDVRVDNVSNQFPLFLTIRILFVFRRKEMRMKLKKLQTSRECRFYKGRMLSSGESSRMSTRRLTYFWNMFLLTI